MGEWKVIHKDCYEISDQGQVRSFDRITVRPNGTLWHRPATLLKTRIDRYGYEIVTLWINGKAVTEKIHRLVAKAFLNNPQNKKEVNHIDGNKLNNIVSNLEWSTSSENKVHAFKNNLILPNRTLNEVEAGEIKYLIEQGFGNSEIGHLYGVTCGCVYSIRKGNSFSEIEPTFTERLPKERFDLSKKLNDAKVLQIKILLNDGFSCADIAKSFAISRCAISDIKHNKTWKHVTLE